MLLIDSYCSSASIKSIFYVGSTKYELWLIAYSPNISVPYIIIDFLIFYTLLSDFGDLRKWAICLLNIELHLSKLTTRNKSQELQRWRSRTAVRSKSRSRQSQVYTMRYAGMSVNRGDCRTELKFNDRATYWVELALEIWLRACWRDWS